MLYEILKTIHILGMVLWIGGMMFVQWFLRPALLHLQPEQRPVLMREVLLRFFRAVIVSSAAVLITGFWMLGRMMRQFREAGIPFEIPLAWWVMIVLGTLMGLVFLYIRFRLFVRFTHAMQFNEPHRMEKALKGMRLWVSVNLALGIIIVATVFLF